MANLVETMERKAFGVAVDATLKNLNKDREKALLQIVDLTEKFMGNNFSKEAYDGARAMIKNPDHKWMRYVNRLLDETDPHVAKMTALNLGFPHQSTYLSLLYRYLGSHNYILSYLWKVYEISCFF